MTVRITRKTTRLLRAMLAVRGAPFPVKSLDLMRNARIGSGSFYPIIARLEREGWVEGEWEVLPEDATRPRRRYYHLTETGVTAARAATQRDNNRIAFWDRVMKGLMK